MVISSLQLCRLLAIVLLSAEMEAAVEFAKEVQASRYPDAFTTSTEPSDYRLPNTTRPVHYNVFWELDIDTRSYSGSVEIVLVATQANVDEIVIHSSYMTLGPVSLTLGTTDVPVTVTEAEFDFLRVKLISGSLQYDAEAPVNYTLSVSFAAPFRTDMHGIYISRYYNSRVLDNDTVTGTIGKMVSTNFKPTYARTAFPCYDEPKYKATFDVTITRSTAFSVWFCTYGYSSTTGPTGDRQILYRRTPVMSTYLLGFVMAAEFNTVMNHHSDGTWRHELSGRSSANRAEVLTAFEMGYQSIDKMSEHTGIDYYSIDSNLRKMAHVAVPVFDGDAVENWGLIPSREAYVLYSSVHGSGFFRQRTATIISKAVSQMWFGNLVTPEFWDNVWLTEGFATYYQHFLTHWVNHRFVAMGLDRRFITEQVHVALHWDSARDPHPLTNPTVGSPSSISAMFSPISTSKAAAVVRMTEHLLGFEVHRQGLQKYLNDRYLDTAVPEDLFRALQEVADSSGALAAYGPDFSVADYYRSWTEKGGYPVVFVNVNHQTGLMAIQQRRFSVDTGYSAGTDHWVIPLSWATASNPDFSNTKPSLIISEPVTVVDRGSVGDEWVIFNKQQTGFYRVNYDDYTWGLITLALRGEDRTVIHEYNRAQIVDDVFHFARSGAMNYSRALSILSFLQQETEYVPWAAAITNFRWLRSSLAGTNILADLDELIIRWASPLMSQLTYYGSNRDDFMRVYLRSAMAGLMCDLGVPECLEHADMHFRSTLNGVDTDANIRDRGFCNGLRAGTEEVFDRVWRRFELHNFDVERLQILRTIGCTPHASRIHFILQNIVEENDFLQKQDYSLAFNSVLNGNEGNTLLVLAFIRDNLAAFIAAFGSAAPLADVAARLRTLGDVTEFQAWVNANRDQLGDSYQSILEHAERSRRAVLWAADVEEDLNSYITNGDEDVSVSTSSPVTNPTTVGRPVLVAPETPDIPGSAVTVFPAVLAVLAALALHAL